MLGDGKRRLISLPVYLKVWWFSFYVHPFDGRCSLNVDIPWGQGMQTGSLGWRGSRRIGTNQKIKIGFITDKSTLLVLDFFFILCFFRAGASQTLPSSMKHLPLAVGIGC